MSWINSLSSAQWLVLLSIPPLVVLLYFLKLKRLPVEIPSTYLWRKALEDSHVNSLWQRLRRSLMLLLQLLFLAALIFACLRPGWSGTQTIGQRSILMIDNSASMLATDVLPNRLESAKAKAKQLVRDMGNDDVAMVIAFSDRADVRHGFTGDRNRLIDSIEQIDPSSRTTDLNEAMRAAAGLANPGRVSFDGMNDIQVAEALPATVALFSDGGFSSLAEFNLGNLSVRYTPIGVKEVDNVAIEAFSILRNEERSDEIEAYGRIVSYCAEPVEVGASLFFDDALVDAVKIQLAPGKESGVTFDLAGVTMSQGFFRMVIDRDDQLLVDNTAYAAIRPSKSSNVLLVTPGNKALITALETSSIQAIANVEIVEPSVFTDPDESRGLLQREDFDLVIFDQCVPLQMPASNTLFIGRMPPENGWRFGDKTGPINLIDLDRTHPMMEFLELNTVGIVDGHPVTPPEGGRVLIRGDNGPVFAIAPRGPFQDAVLGFDIVRNTEKGVELNTDWGNKRSFPLFVYACIEFLSGGATQQAAPSAQPGQPVALSLSSRYSQFEIVNPKGNVSTLNPTTSGQYVFTDTEIPGSYLVRAINNPAKEKDMASSDRDNKLVEVFTANLFSSRESNIAALPDLLIGGEDIVGVTSKSATRTEYWRWLLLLGFVLLVAEWFVFHRRQF